MQPISIFLMVIVGYITLLTMTFALPEQQQDRQVADMRVKRALANKRFYDFGARSISMNDDDLQNLHDEYDRFRRFYDFGARKRFYEFGSKKRSDE